MPEVLTSKFIPEAALTEADHRNIQNLLVAAFPHTAALFREQSWAGARPEYRLCFEDTNECIIAHLDIQRRVISVGETELTVAGIGEVAVRPDFQGRGLGARLMTELAPLLKNTTQADYGILGCLPPVEPFYAHFGWHTITQPVITHDDSGEMREATWITMVLPVLRSLADWPTAGTVDLRGPAW